MSVCTDLSVTEDMSGKWYDWNQTKQPESPLYHEYHLSIIDKIHPLCKSHPDHYGEPYVLFNIEQALDKIKIVDNLNKKDPLRSFIFCGWQYFGA